MSIFSDITDLAIGFITMNSRMGRQEKKTEEIEKNYLHRFDDVKDRIATSERLILDRLNKSHTDIIDRINAKK